MKQILSQVESYFNEGFYWLNSYNIKDNNINYCKELADNPMYDIENGLHGIALPDSSAYDNAILKFSQAISFNPYYTLAYKYRAKAYEALEIYKEAVKDYDKCIKLEPDNYEFYCDKANAMADYDEENALIVFNKAIELNPKYILAYNNRGRTYFSLNRIDDGIDDFEKAIELSNEIISTGKAKAINFYYRAWALDKLTQTKEALADYKKSIKLNPNHFGSYFSRGYLYYNQEKYKESLLDFKRTIELNPNFYYSYIMVGGCLLELKQYDEALIFCLKSIEIKRTELAFELKRNIEAELAKIKVEDNLLYYNRIGGAGIISCNECDFKQEIVSFTHGYEISTTGYQCKECGKFHKITDDNIKSNIFNCECGGKLERDFPLFCPKCKSYNVSYNMRYIT